MMEFPSSREILCKCSKKYSSFVSGWSDDSSVEMNLWIEPLAQTFPRVTSVLASGRI